MCNFFYYWEYHFNKKDNIGGAEYIYAQFFLHMKLFFKFIYGYGKRTYFAEAFST